VLRFGQSWCAYTQELRGENIPLHPTSGEIPQFGCSLSIRLCYYRGIGEGRMNAKKAVAGVAVGLMVAGVTREADVPHVEVQTYPAVELLSYTTSGTATVGAVPIFGDLSLKKIIEISKL
jgi:hypothetical protein